MTGSKRIRTPWPAVAGMILAAVLVASGQTARAASFDCARAATPREQAICADPDLSRADEAVGALYAAALKRLSAAGAARLRDGERQWLAYLGQKCPPASSPPTELEVTRCLTIAYRERAAALRTAAVQDGPYTFTHFDTYTAAKGAPSDPDDPPDSQPITVELAIPQIDQPINPVTTAWNRAMLGYDAADFCDGAGDTFLGYRLGLATSRLISVTWREGWYCHGTAHGNGTNSAQNLVISPRIRPLEPGDIFRADRPWKQTLSALLLAAVEKAGQDRNIGGIDLKALDRSAIRAAAANPKRWSLKKAGLGVVFDPYELGEGYPFAPEVTIPWSALEAVLVRDPTLP